MDIEEAKGRLRLDEVEEEAARCPACRRVREASGDPTSFCDEHLRRVYGV